MKHTLFLAAGFALGLCSAALAANWPSVGGTTARGVVIENGAGALLGTAASPLYCQ